MLPPLPSNEDSIEDGNPAVASPRSLPVPEPVVGVDVRALPLLPSDAFVFTRVDGIAGVEQIARESGLTSDEVVESLKKLQALGAVRYAALHEGQAPSARTAGAPAADGGPSNAAKPARAPRAALLDEAALDEAVDLDRATKQRILEKWSELDRVDHYELLELPRTADSRALKGAYAALAAQFHPDRYFGRVLGSFKPKLEKLFTQITEAHDTLLDPERRSGYDASIGHREPVARPPSAPSSDGAVRTKGQGGEGSDPPKDAKQPGLRTAITSPRPGAPPPEPQGAPLTPAPSRLRDVQISDSENPTNESALRRTLARRLGHSTGPPHGAPGRATSPEELKAKRDLADAHLRRQFLRGRAARQENPSTVSSVRPAAPPAPNAGSSDSHAAQASRPAAPAVSEKPPAETAAVDESYLASSVRLLRIALTREPSNPDIRACLAELEQRIDDEAYVLIQQGEAAERAGDLKGAAEAYVDAAKCKSDATLYQRAAECLLSADLDLRRAGEYMREALRLVPDRIDFRVLLARIYASAGMRQSALTELKRAEKLAPNDESVKLWAARIGRSEPS